MPNKKIILFDVDKTLINTPGLFRENITKVLLEKCAISEEEYQTFRAGYQASLDKYTDFEPHGLLQFITKKENVDQLHDQIFGNKQFYIDSVFVDVLPMLEQLKTEYRLGVFSEAVPSWQKFKLEMADLIKHFDPEITFISRRKTTPEFLKTLPTGAIIIDDNPQVIAELETFNAFKPVWINRVQSSEKVASPTITTLHQLPTILGEYDNY